MINFSSFGSLLSVYLNLRHSFLICCSTFQLPFIIVNTSKKTVIDCSISNDKMEYLFNFDDTFEIHDDMEVNFF